MELMFLFIQIDLVLIAAKCNVNYGGVIQEIDNRIVLIAAKCNVNNRDLELFETSELVLIAAKCNVNYFLKSQYVKRNFCFNSSKV